MGSRGLRVFILIFFIVIIGIVFHVQKSSVEGNVVNFKPVYLSNVSLNVKFSNEGPELFVINSSDLKNVPINGSTPLLVMGKINVTQIISAFNISTRIVPTNTTQEAVLIYHGKLILLESGNVGEFLGWVSRIIYHESHWDVGIYSGHSGVILTTRYSRVGSPENWSAVGGEVYENRVLLGVIVPGKEKVEFSLVPIGGKLLDYYPTTSKSSDLIIHDRSSFYRNYAGWVVENHGSENVNLRVIIGTESSLKLLYSLNKVNGTLLVRAG